MNSLYSIIKKRVNKISFPNKKTFEVDIGNLSLYAKDKSLYYNGLYGLKRSKQLYMNDIVMENCIDFDDHIRNLEFLDSPIGLKIQREYFFKNIYSPIRRWFKKRKIFDAELFSAIVRLKIHESNSLDVILREFDKVVKGNDKLKYDTKSLLIAKYKASLH